MFHYSVLHQLEQISFSVATAQAPDLQDGDLQELMRM